MSTTSVTSLNYQDRTVTCQAEDAHIVRNLLENGANYSLAKVGLKEFTIPETEEVETRIVITVNRFLDELITRLFNLGSIGDELLNYKKGVPLDTGDMGYAGLIDIGLWDAVNMRAFIIGAGYLTEAKIKMSADAPAKIIELKLSIINFGWDMFGELWNHVPNGITIGLQDRQIKMFEETEDTE